MNATGKAWFGRKRVGWGIGPRSWEGWLAIAAYVALMIASSALSTDGAHRVMDASIKLALTAALIVLMVVKSRR
ncbi:MULTISPECIES: hypothetical protein [unclassified Luteibacter]|uniref:hypothetical protein n=1 Tax=unclassified Luteibacter TaxID=2620188 RepID=UPI0008D075D5|nr:MULTISPECIES: hypothetical protein [unclassified Luteibacter]SEO57997.1 hypothetical protein SAMN02800692_1238 [Luteibacter sp. UNC138MFCol5.1]SEV87437.1 hypothetical protein SAMN04515660_0521 [Luteibacter sp. 329MFSha]